MKRHDYHVQFAQATRSRGEGSHSARVSRRHADGASGISVETYARISLEHDAPVVYVCVYAIDVVHECNTPLAEEATREPRAGSDVISVTRLRDWRDGELKGQIESLPSRRACCQTIAAAPFD